jgi:alpha-glucosidase
MNDTSFMIHPGKNQSKTSSTFKDIGSVRQVAVKDGTIHLQCENGDVAILFYTEEIVRVVMNPLQTPTLATSVAVIKEREDVSFEMEEYSERLLIATRKLQIDLHKSPLRIAIKDKTGRLLVKDGEKGMGYTNERHVIGYKEMKEEEYFYGFGEKTSFLNKRGEKMTMWNSDVYAPHNPEIDALYQSIPFLLALNEGKAYGLYFDNTFKTVFDLKSSDNEYSFSAEGGQLDYYIFGGPTLKEVIQQYTSLTGRMPLPPKWAFGYHQSRYSYETAEEVRELVNQFQKRNIPLDAVYLDIHYMDGYRVFTFDPFCYPHPKELVEELNQAGVHVVPIVDPGVKVDSEYDVYRDGVEKDLFCKYMDGTLYTGDVWPGKSVFPDFPNKNVRTWWGNQHSFYTEIGIEGIWNDMNEPAVFNETKTMDVQVVHNQDGEKKSHRELHNVYGLYMGEATYSGLKRLLNGKRPFVLTRAGFSGIQRYAAVWTGDNRSFWEHLQMSLPMCMNLGMSGVPFCGIDVGGFAHDCTPELFARWIQVGAFFPFFRNHSAIQTKRQEPWMFGEKVEQIAKKYIGLRYQWLPYIYTLFREAAQTGVPVMRPMVLEYPQDKETYEMHDQFMLGSDVLIAPVMSPSQKYRVVYLPEGEWYNYWTDERIVGSQYIMVEAPLDTLPIFIKSGAILPHGEVKRNTAEADRQLTIHLYGLEEGTSTFTLYEDDGTTFEFEQGCYFEQNIEVHYTSTNVNIEWNNVHQGLTPAWEKIVFVIHGAENRQVTLNGQVVDSSATFFEVRTK